MQKPLGLQSLLDEESTFPNGTDLSFANKLKQHLSANPCFQGEREKAFTVRHYAGEVFTSIIFFNQQLLLMPLPPLILLRNVQNKPKRKYHHIWVI